jgi:hypothetical protein
MLRDESVVGRQRDPDAPADRIELLQRALVEPAATRQSRNRGLVLAHRLGILALLGTG